MFVVKLFDSLQPVAPCLCKQDSNGWVLALLQRPDLDVAHALATAYKQPLGIRQKASEEEPQIDMCFKNGDVQNPIKARIRWAIPQSIMIDELMRFWRN